MRGLVRAKARWLGLAGALATLAAFALHAPAPVEAAGSVPAFDHIFVIVEENHGFEVPMEGLSSAEHNRSVMKPYGVWGVISPFNFPMALSGGPSSGALVAGNAVVLKPSNQGALLGYKLYPPFIGHVDGVDPGELLR